MKKLVVMTAIAATAIAGRSTAFAHGMRSGARRIEEVGERRALVHWRQSVSAQIDLEFPPSCKPSPIEAGPTAGIEQAYVIDCDQGLDGATFGVKGLGPIITDATLLVNFRD